MAPETPASLGYRWPAEWEPHAATWVAWPHNRRTWPGRFELVPPQFAQLVRAIADNEPVHILAGGAAVRQSALDFLGGAASNISLHDIATNDAWCRDHGPTFLAAADLPLALVDWDFNAWGGKRSPWDLDDAVPRRIAELQSRRRFAPGIVLEGGAIDGNGDGVLLTTASCLLNPNRNPARTRDQLEAVLRDYLAVATIIWLPHGELSGDDTDGHVDQLARFVNPHTVVVAVAQGDHPNRAALAANLAALRQAHDRHGRPLDVVPLPLPELKQIADQPLPTSYCNFVFAGSAVLVPQFDDPADARACAILRELLPDRSIIGLPSLDLSWGRGSFHCLTQQEPVAR